MTRCEKCKEITTGGLQPCEVCRSKKPYFTDKKIMQRFTKKINIPAWGLVLFIAVAILALGLLLQMMIREEKDAAVQNYKEAEYLRSASLHDVQNLVIKEAWYRTGKMLPFIIFILSVGAAFGLANGVALVRVSK